MDRRLQLQALLEVVLGSDAVYYQPPPTVKMVYPCIVYSRSNGRTQFADNHPYVIATRYQVTVIAKDPDSPIVAKVGTLQKCIYDRHFTANNLNHDVFSMYY